MRSPLFWHRWLMTVLVALCAYSVALMVAGTMAVSWFSALGFGPPSSIDTAGVRDYLRLPFMVLGAVLAGWSIMMMQIIRGPLKDGSPWAATVMSSSLAVWFVADTGMSLVLGFPWHALFNVPFGIALGIPLLVLRRGSA